MFCAKDSEDAAKMDMKIILIIKVITVYFIVIVFQYSHIINKTYNYFSRKNNIFSEVKHKINTL